MSIFKRKQWWDNFNFTKGVYVDKELLSKYRTQEDLLEGIPYEYLVDLNKITIQEVCYWIRFREKYGNLPTISQIRDARNKHGDYYTLDNLVNWEDNLGEHF